MCGIVAYTGTESAMSILLDGLRLVEYRGYDSAGVAVINKGGLEVIKKQGKIANLVAIAKDKHPSATCGIGHTRWATHGVPNDTNAHPQDGCTEHSGACKTRVCLVHNGTIENHSTLRAALAERGHRLTSETDTELLAHLIGESYKGDPLQAIMNGLRNVEGAYALAILFAEHPDTVYFAKRGGPLNIGIGDHGRFLASDISSFRQYTDKVITLRDGQIGCITPDGQIAQSMDGEAVTPNVETITWKLEEIQKDGYPFFMENAYFLVDGLLQFCSWVQWLVP
jgi:glucosamine--fructose-6-phosphate aminotransferase (isomerizing)